MSLTTGTNVPLKVTTAQCPCQTEKVNTVDTSVYDDEFAEKLRARVDQALAKSMKQPNNLSPGAVIKMLYPVICKYRTAGLSLSVIATVLQEEGYSINKGHLVRHLGIIEKSEKHTCSGEHDPKNTHEALAQTGIQPSNSPNTYQANKETIHKLKTMGIETVESHKEVNSNLKLVENKTDNHPKKKRSSGHNKPIYTPDDPLILDGLWVTGQPIQWWEFQTDLANPCIPAPLPMPLNYPLPQALRPEKMPEKPTDWTFIDIDPAAGDHYNLPAFPQELPRGYAPTRWWCYRYPRWGNLSEVKLYAVLPGCDPEAPYGRYPDGRPYKENGKVWGIGPNVRQQATLNVIPPGEDNTVDLFFSMIPDQDMAYSWKIVKLPDWEPLYQAWCTAAERCGAPTELP